MYICSIILNNNHYEKSYILFIFCLLWLCSFGQGTAYIKKTDVNAMPMMIRHWNCGIPGAHATYFKDKTGWKGYIGITNVYGILYYIQIHNNCIVHDMAILNNTAYFCGETLTGKALLGWVGLSELIPPSYNPVNLNIDTATFSIIAPAMYSLDNIEAYYDYLGRTCVVGYGKSPADHIGFEYIRA